MTVMANEEKLEKIKDFEMPKDFEGLVEGYSSMGFQATHIAEGEVCRCDSYNRRGFGA